MWKVDTTRYDTTREAYAHVGVGVGVGDHVGRCNKVVTAQKQLTVDRAPPILVVQLKRFDVMSGGGKINKTVTFREQLDIAKVMSEDKKVRYIRLSALTRALVNIVNVCCVIAHRTRHRTHCRRREACSTNCTARSCITAAPCSVDTTCRSSNPTASGTYSTTTR